MAKSIKSALDGKRGKGDKLHTHAVRYERADNGGIHAHVERHTKGGHHHNEHHVIASAEDAAQHLQDHLGDQPQIGAQTPPTEVPPPDAGAGAGPAAGAAPPMDGGGGAPAGM